MPVTITQSDKRQNAYVLKFDGPPSEADRAELKDHWFMPFKFGGAWFWWGPKVLLPDKYRPFVPADTPADTAIQQAVAAVAPAAAPDTSQDDVEDAPPYEEPAPAGPRFFADIKCTLEPYADAAGYTWRGNLLAAEADGTRRWISDGTIQLATAALSQKVLARLEKVPKTAGTHAQATGDQIVAQTAAAKPARVRGVLAIDGVLTDILIVEVAEDNGVRAAVSRKAWTFVQSKMLSGLSSGPRLSSHTVAWGDSAILATLHWLDWLDEAVQRAEGAPPKVLPLERWDLENIHVPPELKVAVEKRITAAPPVTEPPPPAPEPKKRNARRSYKPGRVAAQEAKPCPSPAPAPTAAPDDTVPTWDQVRKGFVANPETWFEEWKVRGDLDAWRLAVMTLALACEMDYKVLDLCAEDIAPMDAALSAKLKAKADARLKLKKDEWKNVCTAAAKIGAACANPKVVQLRPPLPPAPLPGGELGAASLSLRIARLRASLEGRTV